MSLRNVNDGQNNKSAIHSLVHGLSSVKDHSAIHAIYAIALIAIGFIWLASGFGFLPILMAIGVCGLAALFKLNSTYLICLGFVVLSYFRVHEAYPFLEPLKLPNLLALATIGVIGVLFYTKRIKLYLTLEHCLFLAFAAFVAVGILFATNRPVATTFLTDNFSKIVVMLFAITWTLRSNLDFRWNIVGIIVGGSAIAIVAVSNMITGTDIIVGGRVTIGYQQDFVLGDPNDLAAILLFPVSFTCVLFLRDEAHPAIRILALLSTILIVTAIIGTKSRGGYLGILAVFAVLAYFRIRSKTLLIGLGVIAAAALFALSGVGDRETAQAASGQFLDASSQGRINAWIAAWRMAIANPLTGVGLDNFYYNYYYFTPHWDGRNHAVHSTWFGVLAETGFIGLTIFLCLIWRMVKTSFANHAIAKSIKSSAQVGSSLYKKAKWLGPNAEAILAGLIGFLVSATFLTHGFSWPLYILLGLTISLSRTLSSLNEPILHQHRK